MRVLVAGGSGFIGRLFTHALLAQGGQAVWVSRGRPSTPAGVELVDWEPKALAEAVSRSQAVVNLSGEPVLGLWTAAKRERILDSRVTSTQALVAAVRRAAAKPGVFINASAVGWYGDRGGEALPETAGPGPASDFLASTCVQWEAAAQALVEPGVRVCVVRTGVVLHPSGGAFRIQLPVFRLGLAGRLGSGRQFMPWIHAADHCGLLMHLIKSPGQQGAFNAVAPEAVDNLAFTRALGRALRRPALLPVPESLLRLALGRAASILLASQKVLPVRTQASGYGFLFPALDSALQDLTNGTR